MVVSWTIKKAKCWRSDAFELWCWRRLLSPLDSKEIQPVNPKGNQSRIFIGRIDGDLMWLLGKDRDVGKYWRQEEKGTSEVKMVRRHHCFYGHEFEQALGVGDGQGRLACCSSMGSQRVGHNWVTEPNWIELTARNLEIVTHLPGLASDEHHNILSKLQLSLLKNGSLIVI